MLTGKFIALNAYMPEEERSKTNNQSFLFRKLEEREQLRPKTSRRKDIIKTGAKINEIINRTKQRKATKPRADSLKDQ